MLLANLVKRLSRKKFTFERFLNEKSIRFLSSDCFLCLEVIPIKIDSPYCRTSSSSLINSKRNSHLICAQCHARLPIILARCKVCAVPLFSNTSGVTCGDCIHSSPYFERTVSAFDYEYPINYMIIQLKYSARFEVIELLASYLISQIRLHYAQEALPEAIVPMPLHTDKLKHRGFNQSYLIAKILSRCFNIPIATQLCRRIIKTSAQAELNAKERIQNLRGAFICRKNDYKHLAIIDDVMTTGASANELAKSIVRMGTPQVDVWTIARAELK